MIVKRETSKPSPTELPSTPCATYPGGFEFPLFPYTIPRLWLIYNRVVVLCLQPSHSDVDCDVDCDVACDSDGDGDGGSVLTVRNGDGDKDDEGRAVDTHRSMY